MKTLIRGGTVVTATGAFPADVLVEGETIAALLDPAHTDSLAGTAGLSCGLRRHRSTRDSKCLGAQ